MFKMKVCMLGAFAVGKTSLVQQYVNSIFSEKYQTTLGVKIDKKSLQVDGQQLELILWDLAGEDEFMEVRSSYLRGSSAVILVADGTRAETLDIAIKLKNKAFRELGEIPFILLINKKDLIESWTIDQLTLKQLENDGWYILKTSAKDSENVEDAYQALAQQLLESL
ncbi:MAG: GTP-binding protein [Gammaproteobacteria bacterium]|jgi:hypothetical protein|nr:GTP-binding protein [Gammaproteobacteria bacterium]MBT3726057.1 GTP-binding protein [Gammaproteobacteria bacterium]MBT4077684.1 GTP-binding protein [Gammaproteobacteria bacterium]MBT4193096.1 GTP-binding protein [Gammaproteobacteria bacterium]MBT4451692.1 GTP-binding protein [Gammaproteobacteria bacterium]